MVWRFPMLLHDVRYKSSTAMSHDTIQWRMARSPILLMLFIFSDARLFIDALLFVHALPLIHARCIH